MKLSSNWQVLVTEDIQSYLAETQLRALSNVGDKSVLDKLIQDVTSRVRIEIASHPENILDSTPNTLPAEVKMAACHLVIEALQSRIPLLKLTPDQIRNADNSRKFLQRIAQGAIRLSPPAPSNTPNIPKFRLRNTPRKTLSRNNLKGLL